MEKPMSNTLSPRSLRDAFGAFATGVTVVTALKPDGQPVGITANSFTSVSLDPPLILWCIASTSASIAAFSVGASFAVTILGEHAKEIAVHFASRTADKFPDDPNPGPHGQAPMIPGTHLCRMDCQVESVHRAGDHLIIVGLVQALDRHGGRPLAFHDGRFGRLIADATSAPIDVWNPHGVQMPSFFNVPFD